MTWRREARGGAGVWRLVQVVGAASRLLLKTGVAGVRGGWGVLQARLVGCVVVVVLRVGGMQFWNGHTAGYLHHKEMD